MSLNVSKMHFTVSELNVNDQYTLNSVTLSLATKAYNTRIILDHHLSFTNHVIDEKTKTPQWY